MEKRLRTGMQESPGRAEAEPTRERLLEAAAACFAERGYAGTTVRDITARAGCNVGAVSYYFGAKRMLYQAVFEQRLDELRERRVSALRALLSEPSVSLERVLETFAAAFLEPLRAGQRGNQTLLLIMRDMVDGHLPGELIIERMIKPTMAALMEAVDRACPGLPRGRAQLGCQSLVAQLVHVLQIRRLHARAVRGELTETSIEDTVAHIVQFSAAGLRACREGMTP